MNQKKPFGLFLYQKERKDQQVLKDLLQLIKSSSKNPARGFAYVEGENSLLPHISLWENLQLVAGHSSWKEFTQTTRTEFLPLVRILTRPEISSKEAEPWEKFTVSLLKGLMTQGPLLVDMNEDLLSPLIIQNFKKILLSVADERHVYLASATQGLWLDCAHSFVTRKDYEFVIQELDSALVRRHWAA